MAIVRTRPITSTQRYQALNRPLLTSASSEPALTKARSHGCGGRNCHGRITMRRRGGGHRRLLRSIDFFRDKLDVEARVQHIAYDPNRSATIALLVYADGEKRYIPAPENLAIGDRVMSTNQPPQDYRVGWSLPLSLVPMAMPIHCVELLPGKGAQLARGAGVSVQLLAIDAGKATIRLPSGEVRLVDARCRATLGSLGNGEHNRRSLGKAGRNRWLGKRPRVRGVVMNPVDHPMGGGEGRSSGGGHPVSPWGQLSKGLPTRKRFRDANTQILIRRNGKKLRRR
ncbi:MAG: 50S ribosomal protein L2 [Puniceicoccales bacterium]|jgi:large subunit ribosomal protein L2|nr:50S ribosomal protein L2 [Puniceicoccales bacterium]